MDLRRGVVTIASDFGGSYLTDALEKTHTFWPTVDCAQVGEEGMGVRGGVRTRPEVNWFDSTWFGSVFECRSGTRRGRFYSPTSIQLLFPRVHLGDFFQRLQRFQTRLVSYIFLAMSFLFSFPCRLFTSTTLPLIRPPPLLSEGFFRPSDLATALRGEKTPLFRLFFFLSDRDAII